MPSSDGDRDLHAERKLRDTVSALRMTESLTGEIRRLTERRQVVFVEMQAHRRGGHLVPASLCEEIAENEAQLSRALERYRERSEPTGATFA